MLARIKVFIFLSLLMGGSQETFAEDCDGTEGSTRWEACLVAQDTKKIETQLNNKYKELSNSYKENGFVKVRKMLIEAERAWISYRDKTCEFENEAIGGINSISWARCNYRLTKERLEYFENANF